MAVRQGDLTAEPGGPGAVVYAFPTAGVRARARRHHRAVVRRRRTLAAVVVVVFSVGVWLGGGSGAASSRQGAPRSVVVTEGQTLWGIAGRYAPEGSDPRAYVYALVDLNDLAGPLRAGMRLRLPG